MLVVSRNENDRIVFPQLGISVEVIQLSRSKVKLGVDAPRSVRVLRHELLETREVSNLENPKPDIATQMSNHDLRNKINGAMLKLQLAAKLLESGSVDAGLERLTSGIADLNTLENTHVPKAHSEKRSIPVSGTPLSTGASETRHDISVLVVDDDENERALLASYLLHCGIGVNQVSNGMEALYSLSNKYRPDVVLLDMNMPEMDGRATVQRIRKSSQHPDVPVFAVTGESIENCGIEMGRHGITHWFQKPVEAAQIVAAIKDCCAGNKN